MKHVVPVPLATTLLAGLSHSLFVKKYAAPAVIDFPISKRGISLSGSRKSRKGPERRVLDQSVVNSVSHNEEFP